MKGLTPEQESNLILSVGTHKKDRSLSPIEVAQYIQRALLAEEKAEVIARELLFEDATMIDHFTRLLKLPKDIQPSIGWGSDNSTISFTNATELARLRSAEEQVAVVKAIIENRLNKVETRQIVQIRQRSGKPIAEAISDVLQMRPVIERRFLIIGAVQSVDVKRRLRALTQNERNQLLRTALERNRLGVPPYGAKLGPEFFSIVGDETYQKAILALPEGFETGITTFIANELASKEECDAR